jgi:uroporphyrinogen-III decarboxylase
MFGEKYGLDPVYRTETDMAMQRGLFDRYKDIGLGCKDPLPAPTLEVVGHRYMPAVLGCSIKYLDNQPPWPVCANLTDEQIENLSVPDLKNVYPTPEIMRQAEILESKYGKFHACQNLGGIMNTALPVRGDQLLTDFYEKPELVDKLFKVIKDTLIDTYELFKHRFNNEGGLDGLGNCNNIMISPAIYRDFVFKYDADMIKQSYKSGNKFHIHHDSKIDKFLPEYIKHTGVTSFDVGMDSNLALFRQYYPTQNVNIYLYPALIASLSETEIEQKMNELIRTGAPADKMSFIISDIDINLPDDDKLMLLYKIVSTL